MLSYQHPHVPLQAGLCPQPSLLPANKPVDAMLQLNKDSNQPVDDHLQCIDHSQAELNNGSKQGESNYTTSRHSVWLLSH